MTVMTRAVSGTAIPKVGVVERADPFQQTQVRDYSWAGLLVVVALLLPVIVGGNQVILSFCTESAIYAIAAQGLVVSFGIGGQLSLAQGILVGIGGYTAANVALHSNLPFGLVLLAGVLAAALIGAVLVALGGRARGHYLVLITFVFGEIGSVVINQFPSFSGGANGLELVKGIDFFGISIDTTTIVSWYFATLVVLALTMAFVSLLRRSEFGGQLRAVRENEGVARSIGINNRVVTLIASSIGGAIAGLAGVIWAYNLHFLQPQQFASSQLGINLVLILLIGGSDSIYGPFVGSAIYLAGPVLIDVNPYLNQIIMGAIFILVILFLPHGIAGTVGRLRFQRDSLSPPRSPATFRYTRRHLR